MAPHARERREDDKVPEEQVEQGRYIARHGHVDVGQLAEQPVAAEAGRPCQYSQDGGQHQPHHHHLKAIDKAHHKSPGIAVCRLVGQEALGKRKSRRTAKPIKAQAQASANQVHLQIAEDQGNGA